MAVYGLMGVGEEAERGAQGEHNVKDLGEALRKLLT